MDTKRPLPDTPGSDDRKKVGFRVRESLHDAFFDLTGAVRKHRPPIREWAVNRNGKASMKVVTQQAVLAALLHEFTSWPLADQVEFIARGMIKYNDVERRFAVPPATPPVMPSAALDPVTGTPIPDGPPPGRRKTR